MKAPSILIPRSLFSFVSLLLFAISTLCAKPTVCLNMIVKDESPVIERCLKSVKPFIDTWVIVDTGSTDGTQKLISQCMQGVSGELHQREWKNFAHNRNEALALAKNKADYLLFIDADEELVPEKGFSLTALDKDQYFITVDLEGIRFSRSFLAKSCLDWAWEGAVHEGLTLSKPCSTERISHVINKSHSDGHRRLDPSVFAKDCLILEEELKKEPSNARTLFFLAQAYQGAGEREKALQMYQKRAQMGKKEEEVFWSLLQCALLQHALGHGDKVFVEALLKAHAARPSRLEPLYYLAQHYRLKEEFFLGFVIANYALGTPQTECDTLFINPELKKQDLLLELSLCAYYTDKLGIAKLASDQILANPNVREEIKSCVEQNLTWIDPKIQVIKKIPLPSKEG